MRVSENSKTDFQMPEPGMYVGRCVRIIDLGTQTSEFEGKTKIQRQVVLTFELPTELIEDPESEWHGKPKTVNRFYTALLSERASLRIDLTAWRGRAFTEAELESFQLENVLGHPCMVTIVENENGKRKVGPIGKPPKGIVIPPQVNPSVNFSMDPGEFDQAVYDSLSDWFKETIAKSPEYTFAKRGAAPVTPDDGSWPIDDGGYEEDPLPF